jgi:hypothetical protein
LDEHNNPTNTGDGKGGQAATGTGAPPAGNPTASAANVTPPARVYTQEEFDKEVNKRLMKAGRDATALETRQKNLEAREFKISELEQNRQKEEMARLAGNPEALANYQKGLTLQERETKLTAEKAALENERTSHTSELDELAALRAEKAISGIAKELNVPAEHLNEAARDLKISDPEQVKALAKRLFPNAKAHEVTPAVNAIKPFSGKTNGGQEDFSNLSPHEKIMRGLKT